MIIRAEAHTHSNLNQSSSNGSGYTKTKKNIGVARKLWGGGGGGVLSLNTCGGMMFWLRGPTFTFLIRDDIGPPAKRH